VKRKPLFFTKSRTKPAPNYFLFRLSSNPGMSAAARVWFPGIVFRVESAALEIKGPPPDLQGFGREGLPSFVS
jgi:hypothetical protein